MPSVFTHIPCGCAFGRAVCAPGSETSLLDTKEGSWQKKKTCLGKKFPKKCLKASLLPKRNRAEEENMPREEISEEVPQSEPAPETEQVPEGEAPEAEGAEGAQTPAEDASSADEEASERSSNRKKVIIGVSVVVALIVIFIIILLLLLGSCTHRHSMEHVEGVAATCETPGVIDHWHCDECDKDYLDEDGKELITDIVIPAYGHVLATIEGKDPTCTQTGLTEGKRCVSCNEIVEEQEVIPALGHAYREGEYEVTQEPTCTEAGVKEYVCMRCGEEQKESIPALGHDRVETKPEVEPACEQTGLTSEIVCARCGEVLQEQEVIPALDHDPVETKPEVPATCEQTGLTSEIVCSRCKEVLQEQEETDALGHAWGSPVVTVEAHCMTDGKKVSTCMRCGDEKTENIPALGHDRVSVPDVEPECETAGVRGRVVCDRCGMVLEEGEVIPPLGHNIKDNECINEGCDATACTHLQFEINDEDDPEYYVLIGLGNKCTDAHILVPDYYDDGEHGKHPVTTIRNYAFSSISGQRVEQIETISFPYSIKSIGSAAFSGCSNLTSVTFGTGIERIEAGSFLGCTSLTFVQFKGTTENWQVSNDPGAVVGTEIASSDLNSPAKAAELFTTTYSQYDWWLGTSGYSRFRL